MCVEEYADETRKVARKSVLTACGIFLYAQTFKTPLKAFYGLIIA